MPVTMLNAKYIEVKKLFIPLRSYQYSWDNKYVYRLFSYSSTFWNLVNFFQCILKKWVSILYLLNSLQMSIGSILLFLLFCSTYIFIGFLTAYSVSYKEIDMLKSPNILRWIYLFLQFGFIYFENLFF